MKTSNQKFLSLVVAMLFMAISGNFVQAQQKGPQGPPPIPSTKEIKKMVADLSKELSLDEKQETQISILYVAHFEEVSDKMDSGNPSRSEMEKLMAELETEVKADLTEDQIPKYEAYVKKMSAQNRRRRPGGGR